MSKKRKRFNSKIKKTKEFATKTSDNKAEIIKSLDSIRSDVKKSQTKIKQKPSSNAPYFYIGGAAIIGIIVIALLFSGGNPIANTQEPSSNPNLTKYADICVKSTDTVDIHIHSVLSIYNNGVKEPVPGDIGISPGCHKPVHTHSGDDVDGTIHVETSSSYKLPPATLGDFFEIWKQPLSTSQVWKFSGKVTMSVDGSPYTGDFSSLDLKDGQQIVIEITS